MRILQLNTLILLDDRKKSLFFFKVISLGLDNHSFFKDLTGVFWTIGGTLLLTELSYPLMFIISFPDFFPCWMKIFKWNFIFIVLFWDRYRSSFFFLFLFTFDWICCLMSGKNKFSGLFYAMNEDIQLKFDLTCSWIVTYRLSLSFVTPDHTLSVLCPLINYKSQFSLLSPYWVKVFNWKWFVISLNIFIWKVTD
jgi:hypothetical protein